MCLELPFEVDKIACGAYHIVAVQKRVDNLQVPEQQDLPKEGLFSLSAEQD